MKRKKRSDAVKAADILSAIGEVTKEKSINMDMVLDTLKDALASGAKRLLQTPAHIEVKIDREKGTFEVYTQQTVVEQVNDPENEILLDDAKDIDPELEVGDELIQDLDISLFGRAAITTAKQVITQRVREAERNKIFSDYSERIGELVTGTVQQIDRGNILVNLGRTEALLPYREQIRKERYHQSDNIRACIVDVKNNQKGPQVIISRTCPEFLQRLFELEVPEIYDKTVKIVKVVRDPGHRSKIAVTTSDSRVDPVGACVGMRGNRVQAIVRELSNERIDIISWTDELSLLVRRVFSPAEVKKILPIDEKKLVVIIAEKDLAQAIGKDGQNIRLVSKMIVKEIDVYGDEEFAGFSDQQRENIMSGKPADGEEADDADPETAADIPAEEPDEEQKSADADAEEDAADKTDLPVDEDNPIDALVEGAVEELGDSEKSIDEIIDNTDR